MSNERDKQENGVSAIVNELMADDRTKSIVVVTDIAGGAIIGEAGDTDYEIELASGVTYLVIGLGKAETDYEPGLAFVD